MTNLTVAREDLWQVGDLLSVPQAAVKIYKGSLVAFNTAGYATGAADTSGFTFAGIAYETVDNSAGAAGALSIRVKRRGVVELNFTASAVQANVGLPVYMSDDNTVALVATTTNDVLVGRIVALVSTTKVRVDLSAA